MSPAATIALALALAADCFAVALALGAAAGGGARERLLLGLKAGGVFGLMQAGMPVIGFLIGEAAVARFAEPARWIGAALLLAVAAHMLWEAFSAWRADAPAGPDRAGEGAPGWARLFALGLATSIDALGAGFSLRTLGAALAAALPAIGLASLAAGLAGVALGGHVRRLVGPLAECAGAAVLAIIAVLAIAT